MSTTFDVPALVGQSAPVAHLQHTLDRAARSDAKVLITGESGSGKELVAQQVHARSARAKRPFVTINCAGLSDGLLESELFGHLKGSFTGAYRDKPGKFEVADGGTMLMDEVGEMTLRMQGLLLRFLATGEIQKVGSDHASARVDVRIIASTNRDLRKMAADGTFREDLFFRLNVVHLWVPPLRERREDIPMLIDRFLTTYAERHRCSVTGLTSEAMAMLSAYNWPGNVRELQNVIERVALTAPGPIAGADMLPAEIRRPPTEGQPFRERRRTVADQLFQEMVDKRESFWSVVYGPYLRRDVTRTDIRGVVRKGLEESRGNYKIVARMFNLDAREYKRFLNFLRKNDCQLPFRDFR